MYQRRSVAEVHASNRRQCEEIVVVIYIWREETLITYQTLGSKTENQEMPDMCTHAFDKFVYKDPKYLEPDTQVQHLIEKCLIFHMSKDECMEALSKHANIKAVITSTVWNELEKENREFFESYTQSQLRPSNVLDWMSETETSQQIQKMISDSQADGSEGDTDNK